MPAAAKPIPEAIAIGIDLPFFLITFLKDHLIDVLKGKCTDGNSFCSLVSISLTSNGALSLTIEP